MSNQSSETKKMVTAASTCATIGGGAAAAIAGVVGASVTLPVVLVGAMIGCGLGAVLSSKKK
ncbi:MAG: hypothetical protein IKY75_05420 [Bacteroidaceae bacterium]|nr:hypothetical protein [Bacteroidaceae bacterium]